MKGSMVLVMAAATAGACSHAPASGAASVECNAVAVAGRPAGLSGEQACAVVRERVLSGLTGTGSAAPTVTIDLDLSRPGSAIARVRYRGGEGGESAHEIAVDVMDRRLVRDDLVRLADAVTQAISNEMQRS